MLISNMEQCSSQILSRAIELFTNTTQWYMIKGWHTDYQNNFVQMIPVLMVRRNTVHIEGSTLVLLQGFQVYHNFVVFRCNNQKLYNTL
jgi:hypothetical protein